MVLLLDRSGREGVLDSGIAELEVLLDFDSILNSKPDNGEGNHQGASERAPLSGKIEYQYRSIRVVSIESSFGRTYSSSKDGIVCSSAVIHVPPNGGGSTLQAFVETRIVGRLAAGIGESTHVPIIKW